MTISTAEMRPSPDGLTTIPDGPLSALSFAFPDFIANASYEIEAMGESGAESIQVLGLAGSADGRCFATANIIKLR